MGRTRFISKLLIAFSAWSLVTGHIIPQDKEEAVATSRQTQFNWSVQKDEGKNHLGHLIETAGVLSNDVPTGERKATGEECKNGVTHWTEVIIYKDVTAIDETDETVNQTEEDDIGYKEENLGDAYSLTLDDLNDVTPLDSTKALTRVSRQAARPMGRKRCVCRRRRRRRRRMRRVRVARRRMNGARPVRRRRRNGQRRIRPVRRGTRRRRCRCRIGPGGGVRPLPGGVPSGGNGGSTAGGGEQEGVEEPANEGSGEPEEEAEEEPTEGSGEEEAPEEDESGEEEDSAEEPEEEEGGEEEESDEEGSEEPEEPEEGEEEAPAETPPAAVPEMPSIPSMPSMPSMSVIPSMPSMPVIPSMPSMPIMPSIPSFPTQVIPSGTTFVPSGSIPTAMVPSGNIPNSYIPTGAIPVEIIPAGK